MPEYSPSKPDAPSRKRPAHGVLLTDGHPTIVFGTVCTKDRKTWLANEQVHQALRQVWIESDAWWLGRYVIMPDHIHFFAAVTDSPIGFDAWARYWKSRLKRCRQRPDERWLPRHWDTRMRNRQQYEEKWDYVLQNPVRHGLVDRAEDWPYKGEIHELPWH